MPILSEKCRSMGHAVWASVECRLGQAWVSFCVGRPLVVVWQGVKSASTLLAACGGRAVEFCLMYSMLS
eukprot:3079981-Pyramimonas_sp.AAC.1